jgi:nucleoside-diphosphate-sugar epimerase
MAAVYLRLLEAPAALIAGRTFNAGYQNHTVRELAEIVRSVVGGATEIVTTPSDDNRSYHISSERIRRELGFVPAHDIKDAVRGLVDGFQAGRIPDPMHNIRYYNIKMMQAVQLK